MLDPYSDLRVNNNVREQGENLPFYTHISPLETKEIFEDLGWEYGSYLKIICTRNPFNRLVSLYEMIYKRRPSIFRPSFKNWLLNTKNSGVGGGGKDYHRWRKYGTYSLDNLIFDKNGDSLVDKVIKLEEFNKEIPALFSRLNLPKLDGIVKKNVGRKSKKTQEYYDDELVSLVQQRYSWELKKFNYKLF
jgi:hypothetical protein